MCVLKFNCKFFLFFFFLTWKPPLAVFFFLFLARSERKVRRWTVCVPSRLPRRESVQVTRSQRNAGFCNIDSHANGLKHTISFLTNLRVTDQVVCHVHETPFSLPREEIAVISFRNFVRVERNRKYQHSKCYPELHTSFPLFLFLMWHGELSSQANIKRDCHMWEKDQG